MDFIKSGLAKTGDVFEHLSRKWKFRKALTGSAANGRTIAERLAVAFKPVTCPLVLVSQAERSGGSLFAQLFDGHSQLLAHPHELKIGYPDKGTWPPIESATSLNQQFRMLFEHDVIRMSEEGYLKGKRNTARLNFFFLPQAQRKVFRAMLEQSSRRMPRDVLNAYFTSYFNAWINLRSDITRAKFVTGFVPRLLTPHENMDRFWQAYPDGYLITVLRSPLSWYPSIVNHKAGKKGFGDIAAVTDYWCKTAEAMFREKQRQPNRVIVLSFDDLVTKTEATMRRVCKRIGLPFEASLLTGTFNGEPIEGNTSFTPLAAGQISSAPLEREALLSPLDRDYLFKHCMPLYARALSDITEKI
jgi:hypothetical protein